MVWPTARDEAELVEDFGLVIREQDQIDCGFSSFDGMLHWAIGKSSSPFVFFFSFSFTMYSSRSDSTISELKLKGANFCAMMTLFSMESHLKISVEQELVEKLDMPSDAELMQIAVSDLNNASLSLEDFHRETLTGHNDLVILFWVQSPSNLCYFGNMFQALTAINTLLQLKSIEPLILRDFCGLEGALERMKLQLEESMADEDKRDYPADVESLRGEMELIFRTKRGLL
ncbi:hypothetical protein Bca4012_089184 [Brassica carinata]